MGLLTYVWYNTNTITLPPPTCSELVELSREGDMNPLPLWERKKERGKGR
jgi:hypothetical protein